MKKFFIGVLAIILLIAIAFFVYLSNYSKATEVATAIYEENGSLEFAGTKEDIGFIIYPGGKVDEIAYSVIAKKLSDNGYNSIVCSFPFNIGFFGKNVASDVIETHPNIDKWVIVGHSLGGATASIFVDEKDELVDGLVLLASYSTKDLTDNSLETMTIVGSNDTVVNRESMEKYKTNLKDSSEVVIIEGGNHAGFADYGLQKGDGENTIGNEEQQTQTVNEILEFIENLE